MTRKTLGQHNASINNIESIASIINGIRLKAKKKTLKEEVIECKSPYINDAIKLFDINPMMQNLFFVYRVSVAIFSFWKVWGKVCGKENKRKE